MESELQPVDEIYDALDRGEAEQALTLARDALAAGEADDPVLRYLCARALFELDRPADAVDELLVATKADPEDPEFRAYLGWALYRCCRFDEAGEQIRRALELADGLPEAHHVAGLLADRRGAASEAEQSYRRAAKLDPTWFVEPFRSSAEDFDEQVMLARAALPETFRRHLERVPVIVEEIPSTELLLAEDPPLDPDLLGLFAGVPLDESGVTSIGGELPSQIYLFKRNLELSVASTEELAEQIRVTLYHELGHYLGMDEDDLEQSGYA